MNPQNMEPLPVGVAAIAAPAGWEWAISTKATELRGVFEGPKANLPDHIREHFADLGPQQPVPVYVGFDSDTGRETRGREFRARMDAGHEAVQESVRLARQAQARLHLQHPAQPPKHSDRPDTPPFGFDPNRAGQIACDASVDSEHSLGAWAVTSDAGWYQGGLIQADPGHLQSITAELIALHRAVSFSRWVPGETQVFNDSSQAVKAAHLLEGGATTQEVYARWPVLLQHPVTGLYDMFRAAEGGHLRELVWWPRNITPAMAWADRVARAVRLGEVQPTAPTLDLRGVRAPFQGELPRLVVEFIDTAEAAGWKVVGSNVSPSGVGHRLSRTVKVERGGVQLVGVWEKRSKKWVPCVVHRHDGGGSRSLGWDQAFAEFARGELRV